MVALYGNYIFSSSLTHFCHHFILFHLLSALFRDNYSDESYQPFDMIARLDPEFVAYYTEHLSNVPPLHTLPWNPDVRKKPPVAGASEPLKVGLVKDISLLKCKVRVFWPKDLSEAPEGGWPVLLYFHGGECMPQCQSISSKLSHTYFGNRYKGGWTLGSIDTENHLASRLCLSA